MAKVVEALGSYVHHDVLNVLTSFFPNQVYFAKIMAKNLHEDFDYYGSTTISHVYVYVHRNFVSIVTMNPTIYFNHAFFLALVLDEIPRT